MVCKRCCFAPPALGGRERAHGCVQERQRRCGPLASCIWSVPFAPAPCPFRSPARRPSRQHMPSSRSPFSLRNRARGWLRPVAGADPAGSAAVIGSEAAGAPAGRSVRVNPPWWPADLYGAETGDETVWPAANRRGPRTLRTANERLDDPRDRCTRSYVLIGDGLGRCTICCIVTSAYGALAACVGWTTPFPSPWTRPSQTK
jgi:hypothetical protein